MSLVLNFSTRLHRKQPGSEKSAGDLVVRHKRLKQRTNILGKRRTMEVFPASLEPWQVEAYVQGGGKFLCRSFCHEMSRLTASVADSNQKYFFQDDTHVAERRFPLPTHTGPNRPMGICDSNISACDTSRCGWIHDPRKNGTHASTQNNAVASSGPASEDALHGVNTTTVDPGRTQHRGVPNIRHVVVIL